MDDNNKDGKACESLATSKGLLATTGASVGSAALLAGILVGLGVLLQRRRNLTQE